MSAYKRFRDETIGPMGPTGPTGSGFDDISGTPFQLAYFDTSMIIVSTPDAVADIATNQILFSDGLVGTPVISFQDENDTGVYLFADGQLAIAADGTTECVVSTSHISARGGDVGTPGYNFGVAADTDTGMYRVAADTIGFSAGGTQEMEISDISQVSILGGGGGIASLNFGLVSERDVELGIYNAPSGPFLNGGVVVQAASGEDVIVVSTRFNVQNCSVKGGSAEVPAYNFGLAANDINTGMYQIDVSSIGLSAGGVQKVAIYSENAGDFIEGLNVGTTSDIAGIQRLSATASNSWEDGYLGNSSEIVFSCGDFRSSWTALPPPIARSSFHYVGTPTITSAIRTFAGVTWFNGVGLAATKVIPKGFRIPDDASIKIFSPRGLGFDGSVNVLVVDDISIGSSSTGSDILPVENLNWLGGISSHNAILTPITSNGFHTVTIIILQSNTQIITQAEGFLGATIVIERA